jgi:hypothetical protein
VRPLPRWAAGAGAALALLLAWYTSATESMPELHLYDGYWMLLGAALAVGLVAPLVWSWRREWSLPVVVLASVLGCWLPIIWLAVRRHTPVMQRVKGTWYMMGGDVVAAAIPVAAICLWMALRRPDPDRQIRF